MKLFDVRFYTISPQIPTDIHGIAGMPIAAHSSFAGP